MKTFSSQYVGIIKTMPQSWLNDLPNGVEGWEKTFMRMNNLDHGYWLFNLPGKPKYEILYFYLLFSGAIRFRTNIIGYQPEGIIKCYDSSDHYGKVWVQIAAPVVKLEMPVPMKGFQGFRYTTEIFS